MGGVHRQDIPRYHQHDANNEQWHHSVEPHKSGPDTPGVLLICATSVGPHTGCASRGDKAAETTALRHTQPHGVGHSPGGSSDVRLDYCSLMPCCSRDPPRWLWCTEVQISACAVGMCMTALACGLLSMCGCLPRWASIGVLFGDSQKGARVRGPGKWGDGLQS